VKKKIPSIKSKFLAFIKPADPQTKPTMKTILLLSLAAFGTIPAHADLPSLQDRDWAGVFAGFENRSQRFSISTSGGLLVQPLFQDKKIFPYVRIPIVVSLEETLADGSTKLHPILPESLESAVEPTKKLRQGEVRGKFEGGVAFEIAVAEKGEALQLTGKLTDPGDFQGKKVRLRIAAEILNFYGNDERDLANNPKALVELVSKSWLTFSTKDRKQTKMNFSESFDSDGSKLAGVAEAEVAVKTLNGKKFIFEAEGASAMRLEPRRGPVLHRGFFIAWSPDDSAKPGGGDKFTIRVK
jgi:hypothetical protein